MWVFGANLSRENFQRMSRGTLCRCACALHAIPNVNVERWRTQRKSVSLIFAVKFNAFLDYRKKNTEKKPWERRKQDVGRENEWETTPTILYNHGKIRMPFSPDSTTNSTLRSRAIWFFLVNSVICGVTERNKYLVGSLNLEPGMRFRSERRQLFLRILVKGRIGIRFFPSLAHEKKEPKQPTWAVCTVYTSSPFLCLPVRMCFEGSFDTLIPFLKLLRERLPGNCRTELTVNLVQWRHLVKKLRDET